MRSLYRVGLLAGIAFMVLAGTRPSVAVVIYPWCANYGGGSGMGGMEPVVAVPHPSSNVWRPSGAMGALAVRTPTTSPIHRRRPIHHR
jgi:hypothetical protein